MSWVGGVGDFAKGFGEGVWDGAKGMAEGVGHLAKGAWDVATDDDARRRAWEAAVADAKAVGGFVETAVTDPSKAAGQVGDAVAGTWGNLSTAYHQAAAEGHAAEFIGKAVGRTAFEVGTAVVPAGLATKGVEGARLLGRAGEAGELLGGAARGAEAMRGAGVAAEGTEAAAAAARAGEGAAVTADATAAGGVQTASRAAEAGGTTARRAGESVGTGGDTTKAYRVEGEGNKRVDIGEGGSVDIPEVRKSKGRGSERNLYLNFGDEARAREFLQQRLDGGYPDNVIKSFDVPTSFADELRANAVPEAERSLYPTSPVIADPTKAADQFGLPGAWIQRLRDAAVQGSGRVHP